MNGRTGGRTGGQTEFLPILQDFVPCRGRCPATLCNFNTSKRQGKGSADLMMPFGVLFYLTEAREAMTDRLKGQIVELGFFTPLRQKSDSVKAA